MTLRVAVEHRTSYRFDRSVTVYPHVVRLRPAPHCRTPITAYSLTVTPEQHFINWQQDAFGNHLARLVFPEKARELTITVDLVAEMTVINPFDFFVEEYAQRYPFEYPAGIRADLEPYLRRVDEARSQPGSGPGPLLREWLDGLDPVPDDGMGLVDYLVALNARVQRTVAYTVRLEPGVQSPDETLKAALGSCRDSAWLLVAVLRELGLAARFVSGYLVQLTPDVTPLDGPAGPSADFTDLHAWAEVYLPGAGWVGLDPTSGLFAGEGHIPLSATPHPATSAPVTGSTDPAEVTFDFSNTVRRVHEDVRVTKPYSPAQWQRIEAVGRHTDRVLADGDVRLTMGGEPTFVSVDDMESVEWLTGADGPDKRRLAQDLAARLKARWAPDGVLHHGQGKWYPGEPLPRWRIEVAWRADGTPLWRNASLLATPARPGSLEAGSPEAARAASDLVRTLAARLAVPADCVLPAYEDSLHQLWREAGRPAGDPPPLDIDPEDPEIATADRREELVRALDVSPGVPRGWVLPLFRTEDGEHWGSSHWRPRRRHLFLTPGTSAVGLRLPLDAVAWTPPPGSFERSRFEPRGPLPAPATMQSGLLAEAEGNLAESDRPWESWVGAERVQWPRLEPAQVLAPDDSPRTALCVEERDGHLFVFLPPLERAEDAVELLAAVEDAAAAVGHPVVLEGYPLPGDPRLRSLTVTPDPGVIEVNVQPTASWPELTELTERLYADAHASRLGTEKFDLDGGHTGTGGGNHITLGGATPADSPLLRRPDLLRSLVTFWQHHPALSYVFSGKFIGPTSQAPRVDEGRAENLYELEIAFGELERITKQAASISAAASASDGSIGSDAAAPPWIVDRLLRHLLVDITGNTHRCEFCIDKLFSPDSERGRLGLLELRGFEMPPHPRMALVQALLVRSLVARFWHTPYQGPLVRWGTRLHDRFLLPAFAAEDLGEVVGDLREHGFMLEQAWFDPFLEFRFPRLGTTDVSGVRLELRQAIEPWHVLGEESAASGTSRFVDSSVERLQVKVQGLVEGRHAVTCNGVPVPLVRTANAGEAVGGVRYRAWQPPSALHPTIGVHSPLVLDLVDLWNGRSLGGCTYHVTHPGGRSYDRYPVNAAEAEARRSSRFVAAGHTPGAVDTSGWTAAELSLGPAGGEYPYTLDLRRAGTVRR